jgi:putative phage-type endonuclease
MSIIHTNREDWLGWRLSGIGSSDAPIVMKSSPWSTPYKLWEIKTGRAQGQAANIFMRRGLELEPIAREKYQLQTGVLMPAVNVENPKMPFIRASLDGMNMRKGLEIKCPGPKDHAEALAGRIPEKYVWQLRHQMLAADLDIVDYYSFDGKDGVIIPFHREEKPENELLKAEKEFWDFVLSNVAPPYSDGDYRKVTDDELVALCELYKSNKALLDALEEQQSELKKKLSANVSDSPILCAGVAIQTITRKGNVDYAKIPELKGIDLEQFRKKPTSYVDIRVRKGEE